MRDWIKLFEADKTKAKDKTGVKDMDSGMSKGDLTNPNKKSEITQPPGQAASRADTAAAVPQRGTADIMRSWTDLVNNVEPDEEELNNPVGVIPEPEPPPRIDNLPAVINNAVFDPNKRTETDPTMPKWHQVKNLPGYLAAGIRTLGKVLFSRFTETPVDEIQVLSTLSNPEFHVKAMMTWIMHNGEKVDNADIDFDRIMPGYAAEVNLYDACGYQFLCVKDPHGYYIYGWVGKGNPLLGDQGQRFLPRNESLQEDARATYNITCAAFSDKGPMCRGKYKSQVVHTVEEADALMREWLIETDGKMFCDGGKSGYKSGTFPLYCHVKVWEPGKPKVKVFFPLTIHSINLRKQIDKFWKSEQEGKIRDDAYRASMGESVDAKPEPADKFDYHVFKGGNLVKKHGDDIKAAEKHADEIGGEVSVIEKDKKMNETRRVIPSPLLKSLSEMKK